MATVLDEILAESTPKQVSIGNRFGASHSLACNCIYCRSTGYRSTGSHKYWRQRRAERLCAPQKMPAGSSRGLPGALGALPPIIRIGNAQRRALLKQWKQKMSFTQSPAVKQLYTKYLTVVLKRKRPSPYQSVKDIQWLLANLIPGAGKAALAIEIKNYLLQNQDAFIRSLQKQVGRRVQQRIGGINPSEQKVILDMRGQPATWNQLNQLAQRVASETGLFPENVSIVTW